MPLSAARSVTALLAVLAALVAPAAFAAPAMATWSAPIDQTTEAATNEPSVVALDAAGNATTLVRRTLPSGANELVVIDTSATATSPGTAVPLWTADDMDDVPIVLVGQYRLAVNPSGFAIAVWTVSTDTDGNGFIFPDEEIVAYGAHRPAGGSWTQPVQLSTAGRMVSLGEIDLAMNDAGDAVAAWPLTWTQSAPPASPSIEVAAWDGAAWLPTTHVVNDDDYNMHMPQVGLADDGTASIAWVHEEYPNTNNRLIRFVSGPMGTAFGAGVDLSERAPGAYADLKDLTVNGRGDVALAWRVQPAPVYPPDPAELPVMADPILFVGVDEAGDGHPMDIEPIDEHVTTTNLARVTLSNNGATTLIYDKAGATHDLIAYQRPGAGAWGDLEVLTSSLLNAMFLAAVDGSGEVMVAYLGAEGQVGMRNVDGAWQLPEVISADGGWTADSLAANAAGDRALAYRIGPNQHLWLVRELAADAPVVIVTPPVGGTTPPKDTTTPPVTTKDPVVDVKWPTVLTDTTSIDKVPSVIGLSASAARDRFDKVGIEADFDIRMLHRAKPPKGIGVGDVIAQKPAAGTSVTTAIRNSELVRLEIYAGPAVAKATKAGCSAPRVLAAVKGLELDLAKPLLKSMKCPYQVDVRPVATGDDATVTGASINKGVVRLGVSVPSKPAKNDLFLLFRENSNGIGFERSDWTLTAGQKNAFTVQVVDRGFRLVRKANLTFDLTGVGAANQTGQSGPTGEKVTLVTPTRAGIIDVLVELPGADGQSLWGYAQLKVVDRSSAKVGTKLGTVAGRVFQKSKVGAWAELPNGTIAASKRGTGKSGRGIGDLWGQFASWMQNLASPITNAFAAQPVSPEQVLRTSLKQQNIAPAQLANGLQLIGGNVHAAKIEVAGVVAAGGGNVVAAGGGNVIAPGGGNVVAAGGGNVVAAGGGNVVAAGGGNAIFAAGPGVVAAGGGNLASIAAGNVVAAGGGNVIAAGGGNVVASGGLN